MPPTKLIFLLGRKDEPTDAVEEYCRNLATALVPHGFDAQLRRVPWEKRGWRDALSALELQSADWRGVWVFVQYTALAWSARGFPARLARVFRILQDSGARLGIVFHDVEAFSSPRLIDKLRHRAQLSAMRGALRRVNLAVFTVPPEKLSWLGHMPANGVFVPVGPNLPIPESFPPRPANNSPFTVGVFSITGGAAGAAETQTILDAMRDASRRVGPLRLLAFGRHAEFRENDLREGLQGYPVELQVEGILPDSVLVERFRACDVMLFVRGGISTRRSSAIAGIACGIPLVAYSGSETSAPITEAGVSLVSPGDPQQLKDALVRFLTDPQARAAAAATNDKLYREHLAWPAIAAKLARSL